MQPFPKRNQANDDAAYYRKRAVQERAAAEASVDPRVKAVHSAMALEYDERAEDSLVDRVFSSVSGLLFRKGPHA